MPFLVAIGVWPAVCFTMAMITTRSALLVSAVEEDHEFLGQVFTQQGWILYKARTLESAVDSLRRNPVPVVMTERDLPHGDWKDVLAAIQQLPRTPLLIVTARLADEYLWAEVLNLGGHDVLSQPFQVTELLWVFGNAWRTGENNWTQALKPKGRPVLAYAQ
jgi:DNA-binding response OmpR family regulator